MKKLWAIGLNTFREAIRNKVLYSLFGFSLVLIFASLAFGSLSVADDVRLTIDLGLASMSLFGVIIAVFIGVNLVYKELERKTIYTIIPKPVHRYQFVVGKFFGLVLTLSLLLVVMAATLIVVLLLHEAPFDKGNALAMMFTLIFLEVVIITAVAVFFSSFSTPFLSGMFTLGIFLLGRSVPDIRLVAEKSENAAFGQLLAAIARVVPDLRYFFVSGVDLGGRHVSVNGTFIDWAYVGQAALYAGSYIGLILILAAFFFSRRDFI